MWDAIEALCARLAPSQGGAFLFGAALLFLLLGDLRRLFCARNGLLALLLLPQLILIETIDTWESRLQHPGAAWVFRALFSATVAATAIGFVLALREQRSPLIATGRRAGLRLLLALLLAANLLALFGHAPDDVGYYTNLGAQRWRETGTLPYGDERLRGPTSPGRGAAATYGPVLYAGHIPFQLLLGAPTHPAEAEPMSEDYRRPPNLASQLLALVFWLAGIWALYGIGRRLKDAELGLLLACLYAGAPCVFGLGGEETVIGGLPFLSHIAPVSMMLLGLRFADRGWLAGLFLALAAGVLFFPAFFFPAWAVWFLARGRGGSFLLGFGLTGAALLGLLWFGTTPLEGSNPFQLFLECTLEHQEGGEATYGLSPFGFWGQHPTSTAWWQTPLTAGTSLLKPSFLVFAALVLAAAALARGRSLAGLAGLTGALGAGIQIWKTHAQGTYVEWYLPFLFIALCAPTVAAESRRPARERPLPIEGDLDLGDLE